MTESKREETKRELPRNPTRAVPIGSVVVGGLSLSAILTLLLVPPLLRLTLSGRRAAPSPAPSPAPAE